MTTTCFAAMSLLMVSALLPTSSTVQAAQVRGGLDAVPVMPGSMGSLCTACSTLRAPCLTHTLPTEPWENSVLHRATANPVTGVSPTPLENSAQGSAGHAIDRWSFQHCPQAQRRRADRSGILNWIRPISTPTADPKCTAFGFDAERGPDDDHTSAFRGADLTQIPRKSILKINNRPDPGVVPRSWLTGGPFYVANHTPKSNREMERPVGIGGWFFGSWSVALWFLGFLAWLFLDWAQPTHQAPNTRPQNTSSQRPNTTREIR